MRIVFAIIASLALLAHSTASIGATDGESQTAATKGTTSWEALKSGKAIAIMRHALAPGFGDPAEFDLSECSTQRNLSPQGRGQAQRIGDIFRSHGILQAQVITSDWCRCKDTASLLQLGEPTVAPMLNSFFQNRGNAASQTEQLQEAVTQWLTEADSIRVLVTHQVNISALTGRGVGSGDIQIITIDEDGGFVVLEQISAPSIQ